MEILGTCTKLALCSNWSQDLLKQKAEEIFFVNLENNVKIEMQKVNKFTSDEIVETIDRIESMILEEILTAENIKNSSKSNKKDSLKHGKYNLKSEKRFNKKFCTYHKTSSHSDEECRHQKRKNGEYEDKKGKGYSICESIGVPKTIEMTVTINDTKIPGLIDTGASHNFMPRSIFEKLNLRSENIERHIEVETASGERLRCIEKTVAEFSLNGDQNCRYRSNFNILDTKSENLILGMQFLQENDAIINLKENYINLDSKEYELIDRGTNLDEYEKVITDKTKYLA
ncbi:hypothetical protein DMUE_4448 [Dictyocoela muelleri]|nr:hypothetical protein DMUE_4448 [Dictyocoela muelleri]